MSELTLNIDKNIIFFGIPVIGTPTLLMENFDVILICNFKGGVEYAKIQSNFRGLTLNDFKLNYGFPGVFLARNGKIFASIEYFDGYKDSLVEILRDPHFLVSQETDTSSSIP